jgi:hypothetical protein
MAKIPPFRRIGLEDLEGVMPPPTEEFNIAPLIQALLYPINLNFESTGNAFQNDITFDQNISGVRRVVTFVTPADYLTGPSFIPLDVLHDLPRQAVEVTISRIFAAGNNQGFITDATSLSWYDTGSGSVIVTRVAGLQPSTQYTMRLRIE